MDNEANHATRVPGGPEAPKRAQAPADTAETQDAILRVANDLRRIEGRIARLCAALPAAGDDFAPLGELRDTLHCVNSDLIADAIKTLERAATRGEAELRRDFDQRQLLLAAPRRLGWEPLALIPLARRARTNPDRKGEPR